MRSYGMGILAFCAVAALTYAERTVPATFYVDCDKGNDAADGMRSDTAWQTLDKVNNAVLIPGDRVLFKSGGLWRGKLLPQSGSNGACIVYGAYGTGEKPVLQGSVARGAAADWTETAPGIWATRKFEPELRERRMDLTGSKWGLHAEGGAKVKLEQVTEDGRTFYRLTCVAPGKAGHHIQLWGPALDATAPCLLFRMRVRSTVPFSLSSFSTMLNHLPYSGAMSATVGETPIGKDWQTHDILLMEQQKLTDSHFHFGLGDCLPSGAVFDFEPIGVWSVDTAHCAPIRQDVGIVILNHGEKWGVKKWSLEDVKAPLDYWYDPEGKRVFLACSANPAATFKSVELALTAHIVNQGGRHDIVYDGLAVRYGAAHGFGGGSTRRITIRNCDVYWIGGGLQYWHKRDKGLPYPVRYGNGIEFWGNASGNLVERNRLWQIYDAALTNQGRGDEEVDIIYRDNVIWRAEYCFEYWNGKTTANILFEHNTCVDAGYGWAHNQRPDPNGAQLMFYRNPAATTNFVVRNNVFVRSSEVCVRMDNDWRQGLTLSHNLYWQPEKPFFRWLVKTHFKAADFARYQTELGVDAGSLFAEPQFVDADAHDYRLKPGTPGASLAADGGPVGAR